MGYLTSQIFAMSPLSFNDLHARIELEFEVLVRTNFIRNPVQSMGKVGRHVERN